MSAIALTQNQVGIVDPLTAITKTYIINETILPGQSIYIVAASGKAGLADANAAGKEQFRGIAYKVNGTSVDVLEEGELYGFDLSGMNYDDLAYLSDTAGALDTAVSATKTVACGRVVPMSDNNRTKVLRVFTRRSSNW